MIKRFEQYCEQMYVITTDAASGLCVSIDSKNARFNFKYLTDVTIDTVKKYTLDDANYSIVYMEEQYPNHVFEIIPFEELEIKMSANNYNL